MDVSEYTAKRRELEQQQYELDKYSTAVEDAYDDSLRLDRDAMCWIEEFEAISSGVPDMGREVGYLWDFFQQQRNAANQIHEREIESIKHKYDALSHAYNSLNSEWQISHEEDDAE